MKRFNSLQDVRKYLGNVINRLDTDKTIMTESKAKAIGYLANILKDVLASSNFDERLSKMEEELEKLRK